MGVNTAHHAQSLCVAAQVHIFQFHTAHTANGDIKHFAAARNIYADFAVDGACECRQHIQQFRRRKNFRRNFNVIERFQLCQQRVTNAFFIAINHRVQKLLLSVQNPIEHFYGLPNLRFIIVRSKGKAHIRSTRYVHSFKDMRAFTRACRTSTSR